MKAVIRIIQAVLTIIWLCLLALAVTLHMSTRSNGVTGVADWGGFIVADNSMSPELKAGDLAVIHMGAMPKAGDVVLCRDSAGVPELTRIIGTSEGQLILKPDGRDDSRLASPDEPQGVYAGYLPGFGEPFRFLCSLPGVIVIFIAGLILVVLPGLMLRGPRPPKPPRRPPEQRPRPQRPTDRAPERPRPQRPRPQPERPESAPRRPSRGGYTPRH